jgi:hypothetical protein
MTEPMLGRRARFTVRALTEYGRQAGSRIDIHDQSVTIQPTAKPQPVTLVESIASRIYLIRGEKVMLDSDLAELYGVPTSRLNEQVKRNMDRLPEDFAFQLTRGEFDALMSQIAISNSGRGGRRKLPWVSFLQPPRHLSFLYDCSARKMRVEPSISGQQNSRTALTAGSYFIAKPTTVSKRVNPSARDPYRAAAPVRVRGSAVPSFERRFLSVVHYPVLIFRLPVLVPND